jgi:hypothetical protein
MNSDKNRRREKSMIAINFKASNRSNPTFCEVVFGKNCYSRKTPGGWQGVGSYFKYFNFLDLHHNKSQKKRGQ